VTLWQALFFIFFQKNQLPHIPLRNYLLHVECVLGIDGGATSARVALVDFSGNLIGFGMGGPANPKEITLGESIASLEEAVTRAWKHAQIPLEAAKSGFLGIIGLHTVYDQKAFKTEILPHNWVAESALRVGHDLDIAMAASVRGNKGIVLVAGTGSACYGMNGDKSARAGGWGYFMDDPGSGYWLGLQAMRAAVRCQDGRGEQTRLLEAVQQFCRIKDISQLPNIIYNPFFARERIAELAPVVYEVAYSGDSVALEIIQRGGEELSLMITTVAEQSDLDLSKIPVFVSGGVSKDKKLFWDSLESALKSKYSDVRLKKPLFHPVIGAVKLAMQNIGIHLDDTKCLKIAGQIKDIVPFAL